MASPLADLDELVLKCRDQKSRNYIREAVACYKAGAFRSAIISTWIAVSFDIINKLEELTLAGDTVATEKTQEYEKYWKNNDIANCLKFEKGLLELCKDNFEFISTIEYEDLTRLYQDRNRCAHPSMTMDKDMFTPSAEQVRVHIRSAVDYLLQYPPAQGKYALKTLVDKLESSLFPTELDKAIIAFEHSPLNRAKGSLVSNFTIVLIKEFFNTEKAQRPILKYAVALQAVNSLHREIYEKTLNDKLSSLLQKLPEDQLYLIILLIEKIHDIWNYLNADIQNKLKIFVENLNPNLWSIINDISTIPYLKDAVVKRLETVMNNGFLIIGVINEPPTIFLDNLIEHYSHLNNYSSAINFFSTITAYTAHFTSEQLKKIILNSGKNNSLHNAYGFSKFLDSLRENETLTSERFNELLREANLVEFIPEN